MKNKFTVKILETTYTVMTEENEEYVERVAKMVDKSMRSTLEADERYSVTMAAIYAAFAYCDEKLKAQEAADNLRGQLKSYLEDMSKIRSEFDECKREKVSLQNEVNSLKNKLGKMK